MNPQSEKREKIKSFLLTCSHYNKSRLIQGAKNRALFSYSEDDNEVYESLKRFAKHHKIPIEQERVEVKKEPEVVYIEEIDEDGNSSLKKLDSDENLKSTDIFLKELENQRDILSKKLLKINSLINLYKPCKKTPHH